MTSRPGRTLDSTTDSRKPSPILGPAPEAAPATATPADARSRLLSLMSHEIRTPLNVMLGLAQMLQRTTLDDRQRDHVSTLDALARTLLGMFDDVLELLNLEAGAATLGQDPIDLASVLDRVGRTLAAPAGPDRVHLRGRLTPGVPLVVVGDAKRLQHVLVNLVGAAIACTAATEADVQVEAHRLDAADVVLNFVVRCTGTASISAERTRLRAALSPWDDQNAPLFGRRGLGLSISQRLAERMGGTIAIDADAAGGVMLVFSAPFARAGDGRASTGLALDSTGQAQLPLTGRQLLLVDDDPLTREATRAILEESGAFVMEAANGDEALSLSLAHATELNAILMDVNLRGEDGIRAATAFKTDPATQALPVVALTASTHSSDRASCLAAGMNGYLTKPVDPWELANALSGSEPGRRADTPRRPDTGERARAWLERLAEAHRSDAALIAEAIRTGNPAQAAALAHTLSGAAATVGASAVSVAARHVERGIRSGDEASWNRLVAELDAALASLQPAPGRLVGSPPPPAGIGPLPAEAVELLNTLDRQLAAHALGAGRTAALLEQALPVDDVAPELSEVSAAIRGLRFADARVALAGLAGRLGVAMEAAVRSQT